MTQKKSSGLYIAALTAVLALAGLAAYLINSGTNYYAKMGVSTAVVLCLVGAVVLVVLRIAIGLKSTPVVYDLLPICISVLLTVGLMLLLNVRINNLAAVFTFENSAANMADTTSCIVAIACCVLAVIVSIINAFQDMTKKA